MIKWYHYIPFFGLVIAFIQGIAVTEHWLFFAYQTVCTAIVAAIVIPAVIHEIQYETR